MKTFVIDASALLAAWLPEEPYQDQADALLDRYQEGQLRLYAPVLLVDEILNGLYIAVRGKGGAHLGSLSKRLSRCGSSFRACASL